MYFLDRMREQDRSRIYRTKNGFRYPLSRNRQGQYKVRSGEMIRVCMTSDFFLEEADAWRDEAWAIMRQRKDVKFFPSDKTAAAGIILSPPMTGGTGWENIFFNVTCENQRRADERIPLLFELPFKHKGIMTAPLIGPVDIGKYLVEGQIEQVMCGGENYDGSRPCRYEWVKLLSDQCRAYNVTFNFIETGTYFIKNEKVYRIPDKRTQSRQAFRSGLSFRGKEIHFRLTDEYGDMIFLKRICMCLITILLHAGNAEAVLPATAVLTAGNVRKK